MSYFLRAYLSHISGIIHHGDLGLISGSKVAASAYQGLRTGLGLAFLICLAPLHKGGLPGYPYLDETRGNPGGCMKDKNNTDLNYAPFTKFQEDMSPSL